MVLSTHQAKYIRVGGHLRYHLSPLILSSSFIPAGLPIVSAYKLAEKIINQVPVEGLRDDEFFSLIVKSMPQQALLRYVTFELMKKFLVSPKSKNPFFIFLGGLAGKTLATTYMTQQLGINRVISIDEEKYIVRARFPDQQHLWEATYETQEGYMKTVESLLPRMMEKINDNYHDYTSHKKWCYFWEGIYLSPNALQEISKQYPDMNFLSVTLLPDFNEVKRRYMLRWLSELGAENLKKRRNVIDKYLKNVQAIRSNISPKIQPVATFVVKTTILEDTLSIFYAVLYEKLKDLANKEIPDWIEKVTKDPAQIHTFEAFLHKE